jgi:ribosomal protein L37E
MVLPPSPMTTDGQTICKRCGESISSFWPTLRTSAKLQHVEKNLRVTAIVALEETTLENASDWVRHWFHQECPALTANCPLCGLQLKTWRAKQCLHCGHDWHHQAA